MRKCRDCGAALTGLQRRYCSQPCSWRAKARDKYQRDPGKALAKRRANYLANHERELARARAYHDQHRQPPRQGPLIGARFSAPVLACLACGRDYRAKLYHGQRQKFCSPACYWEAHRKAPSVRIWYVTCAQCGRLFTARHSHQRYCGADCRANAQRTYARDYQRRTQATAARYWADGQSPEALAVARQYLALRKLLRQ